MRIWLCFLLSFSVCGEVVLSEQFRVPFEVQSANDCHVHAAAALVEAYLLRVHNISVNFSEAHLLYQHIINKKSIPLPPGASYVGTYGYLSGGYSLSPLKILLKNKAYLLEGELPQSSDFYLDLQTMLDEGGVSQLKKNVTFIDSFVLKKLSHIESDKGLNSYFSLYELQDGDVFHEIAQHLVEVKLPFICSGALQYSEVVLDPHAFVVVGFGREQTYVVRDSNRSALHWGKIPNCSTLLVLMSPQEVKENKGWLKEHSATLVMKNSRFKFFEKK